MLHQVRIKKEDYSILAFYEGELKRLNSELESLNEQVAREEKIATVLNGAMVAVRDLQVTYQSTDFAHAAQTYAMVRDEVQRLEKAQSYSWAVMTQLREALTLFLISAYQIDPTQAWQLDVEDGVISYDDTPRKDVTSHE